MEEEAAKRVQNGCSWRAHPRSYRGAVSSLAENSTRSRRSKEIISSSTCQFRGKFQISASKETRCHFLSYRRSLAGRWIVEGAGASDEIEDCLGTKAREEVNRRKQEGSIMKQLLAGKKPSQEDIRETTLL